MQIYIDGYRYSDSPPSTIPSSVTVTSLRPDLVLVDKDKKQIFILELTVPTNTPLGLQNARERKQTKHVYLSLLNDIQANKWSVNYDTLEVGSLGHFTNDSISAAVYCLTNFISSLSPKSAKSHAKDILLSSGKIAMVSSRVIF